MNLENIPIIGWILKELAALRAMIEGLHAHVQLPAPAPADPHPSTPDPAPVVTPPAPVVPAPQKTITEQLIDAERAAQAAAAAATVPAGVSVDRWADTFPWTAAGGDPLYFKGKATKRIVPPAGYVGVVNVAYGETPAAGVVPAKLSLNGQLFDGPTVRDAGIDIPVSGPTELVVIAMDADGNVDPNSGGSLTPHHAP